MKTKRQKSRSQKSKKRLKQKPSKSQYLGTFCLGNTTVAVTANQGRGGDFEGNNKGKPFKMKIGCKHEWDNTLGICLHEAFELAYMEHACRFSPCPDFSRSMGGFLFVATHEQFSEICAKVAEFAVKVVPLLASAYKKIHPKG